MKKLLGISIVLCMLLVFIPTSFAQTGGTLDLKDLEGLSQSARNEIINEKMKAMKNSTTDKLINIDPEKAEKWANIISGTIKTICNDLSITVNEFIKTPVGKVTLFLIVYKVIGEDIKRVVFACLGWVVSMTVILLLMRKFHMSERIKVLDNDKNVTSVKYVPRHNWESRSDAKLTSATFHVGAMMAVTAVAIAMIAV
jgi:hypothetical protein